MTREKSPKRIVFTTWGSFGDVHPFMALALELQARGHRATVATSEIYRAKITAAGIGFHPVRPDMPALDSPELREIMERVTNPLTGARYVMRELLLKHTRDSYADTLAAVEADRGADMIVSHTVPFVAPVVAEVTGVKWISTVLAPIAFASVYDPPTPPQFPQSRALFADRVWLANALMLVAKQTMRGWAKPIDELRRELGLLRGKHPIFEAQHSPVRVLALFSKTFAKMQPDFPPFTEITGFPFYDKRDEQDAPVELKRFLDAPAPFILFTLGSSAVWIARDFWRTSIEAARALERRALLLVGDLKNLPAGALPPHVAAFEYAPHSLVMPRAEASVIQGGIGTIGQTMRAGAPSLVIPFGHDQPDNARRMVELGTSRSVMRREYKTARVVRELSLLVEDESYRERACEVAELVRAEDGTKQACDAIEDLL